MANNWSSSDRRDRLPPDWPKRREVVKRRAHGQCEWTGEPYLDGHLDGHRPSVSEEKRRCLAEGTDTDHIIPNDDHSYDNLQLLCAEHHKIKTQQEAQAGAARQRAKLAHPSTRQRHPGLVS